MRYLIAALAALALLVAGLNYTVPAPAPLPSAIVKVLVGQGHGSGVHIGDGYILTAAHVTQGRAVKLKLTDGTEIAAETLWENKAYDVALLRTSAKMRKANLVCRTAEYGETLRALGNPMVLEFVTSEGKVAGAVREFGPWKSVLPVDMTIVMGMSGGPVLDSSDRVVGISVGVLLGNLMGFPSLTGFGAIVPSSAICGLMGRTSAA